jgi:hypothetical protein
VGRHAIDLLSMPLDPTEFFLECPRSISEPISAGWAMPIEFGVVPLEAVPSPGSSFEFLESPHWSHDVACLLLTALSASRASSVSWAISSVVFSGGSPPSTTKIYRSPSESDSNRSM